MEYKLDLLEQGCKDFGIELTQQQKEQFVRYYEILVERNQVMNLTAITEFEEVLVKHFVDSLAVSGVVDVDNVSRVIDIGTGAGFPGIPLKIVYPHLEITLLDSLRKRIGFLNEIVDNLGLKNVETIHGRAEEYAKQKEYREIYDLCVSRAVANLSTLSEYCLPYVKVQGYFVPYKSGKIEEELHDSEKALRILGGRLENVHKFELGDAEMGRSLVIIKKEKSTPKKYPRKAGMPSKEPLT